MLSLFRRIIYSRLGVVFTLAFLLLIGVLFALSDVGSLSTGVSNPRGDTVATVGNKEITAQELTSRVRTEMEGFRQRNPGLDMATFVNEGGFDGTLERLINGLAFEQFAKQQGMAISKIAIDKQIASIPALRGPDGKFSQATYDRLLAEQRMTDAQVRTTLAREMVQAQLLFPTTGASQVPGGVALPYASLLLERRAGKFGFIPTQAVGAGAPPTDVELASFFQRNKARYTIPERRSIRYAMVTVDQVRAQITPSADEVAQAYADQKARYAPTEKRTITQVIVLDKAGADALAAKMKAGTPIDAAARAAGLEPAKLTGQEKAAYATAASPAMADAVFGAASGAIVGPIKVSLGFAVARVDSIEKVPGKTLDQAREEITKALTEQKRVEVLGRLNEKITDAINERATFDEIIADQKLTARATPPLLSDGRDPNDTTKQAAPDFMPIVTAAFQTALGESPQIVPIGTDGGFAIMALDRVVAPTLPPIAQIKPIITRDFLIDRARAAARKAAADVVARVSKGEALEAALAATGLKLPKIETLEATRAQIMTGQQRVPPAVALMFSMRAKTAKLLEAPNNAGWIVVSLDRIDKGDAAGNDNAIRATQADIGRVVGREYDEQFAEAVRRVVGVKRNEKAIAAAKAALLGTN